MLAHSFDCLVKRQNNCEKTKESLIQVLSYRRITLYFQTQSNFQGLNKRGGMYLENTQNFTSPFDQTYLSDQDM